MSGGHTHGRLMGMTTPSETEGSPTTEPAMTAAPGMRRELQPLSLRDPFRWLAAGWQDLMAAKGIAESCINPGAPALANAVYDATGVRFRELPLTPERIFEHLKVVGASMSRG